MAVATTEGIAIAQRRILNSFLSVSRGYLENPERAARMGCHTRGSNKLNGDRRAAPRSGLGRRNPVKQIGESGRDGSSLRYGTTHQSTSAKAVTKGIAKWPLFVGALLLTMVVARA